MELNWIDNELFYPRCRVDNREARARFLTYTRTIEKNLHFIQPLKIRQVMNIFNKEFNKLIVLEFPCFDVTSTHTEKSYRIFIKSNRNQIVFTTFRLIWNQTFLSLVQNQSKNRKYNQISCLFNKIPATFTVCV